MDETNLAGNKDFDVAQQSLSQQNSSQSEDENITESNMESVDEDILFNDIADDDDDLDSSSDAELPASPDYLNPIVTKQSKNFLIKDKSSSSNIKLGTALKSAELNQKSNRSSGRLRKEGKVPIQRKNLFPGRPRIRRRKFANSLNISITDSFKSPSNANLSEPSEQTSRCSLEPSLLTTEDSTENSNTSEVLNSTADMSDVEILSEVQKSSNITALNQNAKKKMNYASKIKGKLSGRKKANPPEYRRKRGPRGKYKNNFDSVPVANFPSTSAVQEKTQSFSYALESDNKQDDSNESKIILCSSKDYFILSQDVCIVCGSLGKDEEGRLLSCSQCGQCYHPFCAGVTKITNIMLKKGWRCLECTVCEICGKPTDESRLLLCDDCDISYHTYCLDPPLEEVPQGTWKCQWCVVCVKCDSTLPGHGSQWQANYTLCGPCASQENCIYCKSKYEENDLIIQCIQCNRWLHSKCDSMFDEDECEIASCIGYNCLFCRPKDESPPHIKARKNGTLRAILNKMKPEDKSESTESLNKKAESFQPEIEEIPVETNATHPVVTTESSTVNNTTNKLASKYHLMDGVYLSDTGVSMIKPLLIEQPKRTRVKRKNLKNNKDDTEESGNKDFDDNFDERSTNDLELLKQTEEEKKEKLRRQRLEKLGIGGFSVKQRGRLSLNKEEEELNQEATERSGTPDALDKPKRRRRINKKKSQLEELFPSYMQEAFFGKELLDSSQTNGTELCLSDKESEDDDFSSPVVGKDKTIDLSPMELNKSKENDDIDFLDDNFQESLDDDLQPGDGFDDFPPLTPDDMLMNMLINDENLGPNDEVLDELTNDDKVDEDEKDDMDILDSNFNFNDIVNDSGLVQMDSKDVEDLFNEVILSDSSLQQPKEFPLSSSNDDDQLSMIAKPNVDSIHLPEMVQPKLEMSSSNPVTPISTDSLSSLQQQFASFETNNQSLPNQFASINKKTLETQSSWQSSESDAETSTQGQKNLVKWEAEEALGNFATISPVLFTNMNYPNLKIEFPLVSDRVKQISKLWRQLSTEQRQPYLQKARENRAANRVQKSSQSDSIKQSSGSKEMKNDNEKQWKDIQGPHSNDQNSNISSQSMSSQSNEMCYTMPSDYGHSSSAPNQLYSSPQINLHSQPKMQPSNPLIMNRTPSIPGPVSIQSPLSPSIHSPRLRPGMPTSFSDNFSPQHQMNMVRTSLASQGSFSPASPNLNQVHSMSSAECYQSSPATPQRPQSTEPQHSYNQTSSPYGAHPRTPSSMVTPFSPNHHSQMTIHTSALVNETYPVGSHQTAPPSNVDNGQNIDMYKVNITPQHQISKPLTPDSYVQSMTPSLPTTPQPSPSPQQPTPPLADIYARSPATPRPINQQIRPSQFDESYNQRPMQTSEMYSPNSTPSNYQPQYSQVNSPFNPGDNYVHSPGAPKVQIRPSMLPNVRPNVPIRRAVSDPYARQPMTPMPTATSDSSFIKQDENPNDPLSKQQQLRNLLQVQQMRRQETSNVSNSQPRPPWIDNNSFRQPLSPAINRNRAPMQTPSGQFGMEQTFRYPNEHQQQQRMLMQRNPELRFRQMGQVANQQFSVRFGQQQQIGPLSQAQQSQIKVPQQQWPRMPSANQDMNQMMQLPVNQMSQSQQSNLYQQNYPQIRPDAIHANETVNSKVETKTTVSIQSSDQKPSQPTGDIVNQITEDEGLPVELGDDDDLFELGNEHFNILEYGDPELADSALSGNSGKSNIFDELDEKDMLNEKDKDNEKASSSLTEKPSDSSNIETKNIPNPNTNKMLDSSSFNPSYNATDKQTTSDNPSENNQMIQKQDYFQNLPNADSFLSDDDFERLKNDFLNDPSDQINSIQSSSIPPFPSQSQQLQQQQQPQHSQQHVNIHQPQSSQVYHQHTTQYHQNQIWQEQSFNKNYPNRMPIRVPMNQPTSIPRHLSNPSQQPIYSQASNRMMLPHPPPPQAMPPQSGHLPMPSPANPVRQIASIPPPPMPQGDPINEQDRLQIQQYEQWLYQQNLHLGQQQTHYQTEITKIRKMKKSLNSKKRQCLKNQNEFSENDTNELDRLEKEKTVIQKLVEQSRKMCRHHTLLIQEFRQKYGQTLNLPHSPGAQTVQTSPRSVNSPLTALNTSGPGTPLGIAPSTPQSPSITSPSPSSLMQNSPMSNLHSPASMLPHSPIHHSPMPSNPDLAIRPQIVQEDNNPFSDVYLQKEKKQHMLQAPVYNHQMPADIQQMSDSRQQIYPNTYSDDNNMQQYYHSQQSIPSYQMQSIRPQSQVHFQNMNDSSNFRFNSSQAMNSQYPTQQVNYQQIRRPPPPPYPGSSPHYVQRPPYQPSQQIRPPIGVRTNPDCISNRVPHPMYGETSSMMTNESSYAMNQQTEQSGAQHMAMPSLDSQPSMNPLVGEAKTTLEFNISELGPGHDNESDPSTLVKESNSEKEKQSVQNSNATETTNNIESTSSVADSNNNANVNDCQNNKILSKISIKNEIKEETTNIAKGDTNIDHLNEQSLNDIDNQELLERYKASLSQNSEDNYQDDSSCSKQEATRQNALLKQLLQNCPSADLKNLTNEAQLSKNQDVETTPDNEIKIENDNTTNSSCMHASGPTEQQQNENINIEPNAETPTNDNIANDISQTIDPMLVSSASNATEKKLTYLDIRRAQLERDPTPPPEEIKPKRKRTVKRKESKSVDEQQDSNLSSQPITTPKSTKKRQRKGSQTRTEEIVQNDNEQILNTILNHVRSLPPVNIIEPVIKQNLNICLTPDASDLNSTESKLRGCYGNAFLSSTIDYYATYPFGPNKATSVVPTLPPAINSSTHSRGFYNEEFNRTIPDLKDHFKERYVNENRFSLYARDIDSPETVVSSSSPECVLYDHPKDEYNKMKYINDEIEDSDVTNIKSCDSPLISFMPMPIRPIPLSGTELIDNDKENLHENQKSKILKVNSAIPLKESGNVGITLMLASEQDVRNILTSLAKILNINSPLTYNIDKSPLTPITATLEFCDKENDQACCKFCQSVIKEYGFKPNTDDIRGDNSDNIANYSFCNKKCFNDYASNDKINVVAIKQEDLTEETTLNDPVKCPSDLIETVDELTNDSLVNEIQNETIENEIMSIFGDVNEDLDSNISIHEKQWKNTRYLYWTTSAFNKNESKPKEETKETESAEEALDKLEVCLKPKKNFIEKRTCIFCHQLGDGDVDGSSRLLNMDVDKWVHLNCALWSTEVYEMCNGALMNVDQAYKRAMNLHCASCAAVGASLKCFKVRCNNSYHFPCALKDKCMLFNDKTFFCPQHSSKTGHPNPEELTSFEVRRRVFINRDEQKQIAAMIHQGENNLMRIGSLIFLNIGQLLPHQLQAFHTNSYIYPIGYKLSRFYWSSRRLGKRCQYICSINEVNGKPEFSIEIREEDYENVVYKDSSPKLVWQKIIESIAKLREESQTIKVFTDYISGEDLFGLTEPAIIRILESLPGVDTLYDYTFKYGRSPWYELPLAINPTGCARTEPKMRTHFKRPHTLHVSSNHARSSIQASLASPETSSPYVKQFVHSKVTQYRKMKSEWRNNVYLARSGIQGLGLYAVRDIEKHTMIIEYIGLLIRNEIAERNERIHVAHNRGIYMFRLDDNRVIDATLCGGLARYVNHSCDPNCVTECVQIDRENKILIIANRRIQRGEELTYDYKFDVEDDQHKIPCNCGAANCRKWMN